MNALDVFRQQLTCGTAAVVMSITGRSTHGLCNKPAWIILSDPEILVIPKFYPANTKHLYIICTMLGQRRRRWVDVVQMFCVCWVVIPKP